MTPKEKAYELVDKFGNTETDITFVNSDSDIELASGYLTRNAAKQCAIIAVDEILIAIRNDQSDDPEGQEMYENYWNEVKTEINAL